MADMDRLTQLACCVSVARPSGYGYALVTRRCCPSCRGYRLERGWCHLCNGKGYVEDTPDAAR